MYRRFLIAIAALTIVLMVVPPVCDSFDTWDKTPEIPLVGHNTETTVAGMGLDAGISFAVAWASVLLLNFLVSLFVRFAEDASVLAQPHVCPTNYLLLLFSPPWELTTLRI